eukprot:769793_1
MKHKIHDFFQRLPKGRGNTHVNEWINIIKLMKKCDYKLNKNECKQCSIHISDIIRNCGNNMKQIKYIHGLIRDCYDTDIYIKTALMNAYGFQCHQSAFDIFNSIHDNDKDAVVIGVIMKILIKSNQNEHALELYHKYQPLADHKTHILAIKAAGNIGNFAQGQQIYAQHIGQQKSTIFVQTALIDFYGKFGKIDCAFNEFHNIKRKNTVSLNAMLTVYVNHTKNDDAMRLYDAFRSLHDDISHVLAIKACANTMNLAKGMEIHGAATEQNACIRTVELNNALIDMYGRCGDIHKAMNIFNAIQDNQRSTVSINSIMNVSIHKDLNESALSIYINPKYNGLRDDLSHTLAIKACIKLKDFAQGQGIITQNNLLETDSIRLKNILIDFYGNSGDITQAKTIFRSIDKTNVITVNSMMTAFIRNECFTEAICLYDDTNDAIKDDVSHTLYIKSCRNMEKYIDTQCFEMRDDLSVELRNSLMDFYGHSGDITKAEKHFHVIEDSDKTSVAINTMMNAYNANHKYDNVLSVYHRYNTLHDHISHIEAIKACMGGNKLEEGQQIHSSIIMESFPVQLTNTLIDFYGHFGLLSDAWALFNDMSSDHRDIVSVNSMMKALIHNDMNEKALSLYNEYECIDHGNEVSHLMAIRACTNGRYGDQGKEIHHKLIDNMKNGLPLFIKTALIDFYGTLENIALALNVFGTIGEEEMNSVAVNSMNTAYINNGYNTDALLLYDEYEMFHDDVSHLLAIKACTNTSDFEKGMQIYTNITMDLTQSLKVTLIDFFGNYGDIEKAIQLFDSIADVDKDIIAINAMMEALCDNDLSTESIHLFQNMHQINETVRADHITYSIFFKACTQSTMFHFGHAMYCTLKTQLVHKHILNDLSVQINLINMFGKCGMMELCEEILNEIKTNEYHKYISEIGIWNAIIKSFGRNGNIDKVKEMWDELQRYIVPGVSTYIIVINAYGHCGDVVEAKHVWCTEINDDDIKYDGFVIATLVDCHSRNAQLQDGLQLIYEYERYHQDKDRNDTTYRAMWMSLLSGCRKYKNMDIGNNVYREMETRFNHNQEYMAAASTLLANIHAASQFDIGSNSDCTQKKDITYIFN